LFIIISTGSSLPPELVVMTSIQSASLNGDAACGPVAFVSGLQLVYPHDSQTFDLHGKRTLPLSCPGRILGLVNIEV
jgi:hypothetical protein